MKYPESYRPDQEGINSNEGSNNSQTDLKYAKLSNFIECDLADIYQCKTVECEHCGNDQKIYPIIKKYRAEYSACKQEYKKVDEYSFCHTVPKNYVPAFRFSG